MSASSFAKRLKAARRSAGVSAQALSDATGVTRSVIANIESGRKKSITVDEIVAFSAALGITPGGLDERLESSESRARRNEYRASLKAQISRLQAELDEVSS
ncbi:MULTISPECIES: helix-turn-helix transcriptional regulator [Microbacterium]|uniref:helix-turn-helix domain-containing protein n=1 Tax=Microbacterium TaxID=33882 RepID=UPI0028ECE735|nr:MULTISPECIES: helix-turn-helix transcriptional regulator [Microbacterium]